MFSRGVERNGKDSFDLQKIEFRVSAQLVKIELITVGSGIEYMAVIKIV